jgi:hypothetical protein
MSIQRVEYSADQTSIDTSNKDKVIEPVAERLQATIRARSERSAESIEKIA